MVNHRYACARALFLLAFSLTVTFSLEARAEKQFLPTSNSLEYKVRPGVQRVTMYVNSSKILTLEGKQIPRALVNNPELVNAIAISPNQIQLSGLKAGVTQINLWDDDTELYSIDIVVYGDAKELELLLETEFPNASLRVRPLQSSVVLSGWVDSPEVISRVVRMAEDYYPKVINNISVGDNQQVMLHVQVMEVSRTKLRQLGFDWANFGNTDFVVQSVSGLLLESTSNSGQAFGTGGSSIAFGITGPNNRFFGVVDALRQYDLVKVLAEPVLTTVSGRPAAFNAGGEFPILIPQGLGTVAVEFKQFGTRVDFVPIVLGNGNIRLEVRPQVSEIDNARGVDINGTRVPGLRNRWVDTAVEMRAGQTLALAGLIQDRVESQNRGIPWLADMPWAGSLFRRTEETTNEIELLVMVRPELVAAMDPDQVPMFGPGEQTDVPSDKELYFRGYLEIPSCCPDGSCRKCRPGRGQFNTAKPGATILGLPEGAQNVKIISEGPSPGQAPAIDPVTPLPVPFTSMSFGMKPVSSISKSKTETFGRSPESANPSGTRVETGTPRKSIAGLFGQVGYDVLD
jgi:pilus assembly protein CpaC